MRALLLLLAACGSVVDPVFDAGVDSGVLKSWDCSGYRYCSFPDGGRDPRHFSVPLCFDTEAEATAVVEQQGPAPCTTWNFACHWDGGSC